VGISRQDTCLELCLYIGCKTRGVCSSHRIPLGGCLNLEACSRLPAASICYLLNDGTFCHGLWNEFCRIRCRNADNKFSTAMDKENSPHMLSFCPVAQRGTVSRQQVGGISTFRRALNSRRWRRGGVFCSRARSCQIKSVSLLPSGVDGFENNELRLPRMRSGHRNQQQQCHQ
jgi:hypothetical protein